jgi:hypothetical protein
MALRCFPCKLGYFLVGSYFLLFSPDVPHQVLADPLVTDLHKVQGLPLPFEKALFLHSFDLGHLGGSEGVLLDVVIKLVEEVHVEVCVLGSVVI